MEKPLFWHQGLFLQPQHLQLQDRYVQSLAASSSSYLQPHYWGVASMRLHEGSLGNLSLSIQQGEFLFADGTVATFPGNSLLDSRAFNEGVFEGGKPLGAYIGLRKWNPAGENVTVLPDLESLGEVTTRYVTSTESDEIVDLHQGGAEAQVRSMYFALKLFWESEVEQLGDFELVPVVLLTRSGEEVVRANRFFPPCVNIAAIDSLHKLVVEIRDQLTARTHQLEAYKRSRGIHTADFGARDTVYLLALRSLNRYVPLLFHLTESPMVHPWAVYGVLRQIVGELSSFSEGINVLGELEDGTKLVPVYNHRKLSDCFYSVQKTLIRLLDEITAGPEYVFELIYDGTYYTTDLHPSVFEGQNRFYLVLQAADEDVAQLQGFTGMAKMGARESLPILIARALPGVKTVHLENPPQELPRKTGAVYYQIDLSGNLWQQVQSGRNLAIFWDSAPADLKAELMIAGRR
ncbi:type VI secretion system baseplate subunit TssK [Desulfopila sp. IMCC35008]|uniref:type VI secretion system baseplate subunit TssK n=1 Tax=Desulfopila sp. IMCC35008 TaxID=2653858 RepID=UPI0013D02FBA|nr:type VI secretion system baseplate subunit TssK [Desulfopila sp. IMCC35008]